MAHTEELEDLLEHAEGNFFAERERAERLQEINADLVEALESIKALSPGGPHISAKAGFEANLAVVGQARILASNALARARGE